MLTSLRSAMVICATLVTISVAPAQADPGAEPLIPATSASLPEIRCPNCSIRAARRNWLNPFSRPTSPTSRCRRPQPPKAAATGNLGDMVTQFMASQPGTRELECLATGIYFESKSEPLLGQLAVGKVIANRAKSGGRFPVILLRRAVPARPILVHSRPQPAVGAARRPPVADGGGDRPDCRCGPEGLGSRERLVLSRAPGVARMAAEAHRDDRQPHLLSLTGDE